MVVRACIPSYSGGWGRRIAWTQEVEVEVNRDRAIALQPGQQEQNSVSKKNTVRIYTAKREEGIMGRWNSRNEGAEMVMCIACLWNKDLDPNKTSLCQGTC